MRCSAESESLSIMADEQKVRYLPTFYYDLLSTVTYIKDVLMNPIAARQLVNDVESTILETSKNPGIFEPYRAERKLEKTYYRVKVRNYYIFYTIEEDGIMEVCRLVYARSMLRPWQ